MLNGKVGVSGPRPVPSTSSPPANCIAWIQLQSAIDQADGRIDVWFKVTKAEKFGIVPCCLKRATSKVYAELAILLQILAPEIYIEKCVTHGHRCESRPVTRITLESLSVQIECAHQLSLFPGKAVAAGAQYKVVCAEVIGRPPD
jgi:hypothetical protein